MDIVQQLGQLVLGSVPTILLFLFVVFMYQALVYKPLHKVLAERRTLTTGAMEDARMAISRAEHKTTEYEGRLRLARNGIALAREHRMQQWNAERDQVISAAQERAALRVQTAKIELHQSVVEARVQIEHGTEDLSRQVLAAVLPRNVGEGVRA